MQDFYAFVLKMADGHPYLFWLTVWAFAWCRPLTLVRLSRSRTSNNTRKAKSHSDNIVRNVRDA